MTPSIVIHIVAAAPALVLGAYILARPKGTRTHKMLGRIWVGLMLVVVVSSIWIQEVRAGEGFSWIHGLSVFTFFSLAMALNSIRQGWVSLHRLWMIGTYLGLIAAAAGTLAPGRIIGSFLFG